MRPYILLLGIIVAVSACTGSETTPAADLPAVSDALHVETSEAAVVDNAAAATSGALDPVQSAAQSFQPAGQILAGSTSPYVVFNQADYDAALSEGRTVLLYFYANWCPICMVEQRSTTAAFNELQNPDVVGFRVNYKDGDTDSAEEALAKSFGITYQHTKVILKDGEQTLKDVQSWDKETYLKALREA